MTARSLSSPRRVLLLPTADRPAPPPRAVRRFRLARLGFVPPPASGPARFEYLKRRYD